MKRFYLKRLRDISGVSGIGIVAEGVIFKGGWCALHWLSKHSSLVFYPSLAAVRKVHGHQGSTQIIYKKGLFHGR